MNEFNYLRIQLAVPILAKSTQSYLAKEFSLKPRVLYSSNDVVGAATWRLCPDDAGMSNAGDDVRLIEKACQIMLEYDNSTERKNPFSVAIARAFTREERRPAIDKGNYVLSFITIDLPFRTEVK